MSKCTVPVVPALCNCGLPGHIHLYSSAECSVSGFDQAVSFCRCLGIPCDLKPSTVRFRFVNGVDSSIGRLSLRVALPNGSIKLFDADVLIAYIPVLMGLDVMQRCGLILDFDDDEV